MNIVSNDDTKCTAAITSLKEVIDPEIGLNIVDLGLIYAVNFMEEEKRIICVMTLTTEYCPMGESIVDNTRQALQSSFSDFGTIEVNLTFDPHWSYSMISEEGRKFLGR
ncbi:metal-sulfur cluster assembly factor [Ignavibacteria bacterium]|nr:metal-sulfur cluster assembly factor [Bacteroidota bacterium]MCZ2132072.1 metal-sulfur cluster assembly factor [Bacteroidota bacterium]